MNKNTQTLAQLAEKIKAENQSHQQALDDHFRKEKTERLNDVWAKLEVQYPDFKELREVSGLTAMLDMDEEGDLHMILFDLRNVEIKLALKTNSHEKEKFDIGPGYPSVHLRDYEDLVLLIHDTLEKAAYKPTPAELEKANDERRERIVQRLINTPAYARPASVSADGEVISQEQRGVTMLGYFIAHAPTPSEDFMLAEITDNHQLDPHFGWAMSWAMFQLNMLAQQEIEDSKTK